MPSIQDAWRRDNRDTGMRAARAKAFITVIAVVVVVTVGLLGFYLATL